MEPEYLAKRRRRKGAFFSGNTVVFNGNNTKRGGAQAPRSRVICMKIRRIKLPAISYHRGGNYKK